MIVLDDSEVSPSSSVIYLEVILHFKLDFPEQIDWFYSKVNSGIRFLRRLSCFGSGDLFLIVVFTHFVFYMRQC